MRVHMHTCIQRSCLLVGSKVHSDLPRAPVAAAVGLGVATEGRLEGACIEGACIDWAGWQLRDAHPFHPLVTLVGPGLSSHLHCLVLQMGVFLNSPVGTEERPHALEPVLGAGLLKRAPQRSHSVHIPGPSCGSFFLGGPACGDRAGHAGVDV